MPALIPEDYLPDINSRLILYKRIAAATSDNELRDLQVEMIDRFGLLPVQVKNLFLVAQLAGPPCAFLMFLPLFSFSRRKNRIPWLVPTLAPICLLLTK